MLKSGDKVHARMRDGDGNDCWSRFPWTVMSIQTASDGGDMRIVIRSPSGDSRHTVGPEDVKRWEGHGR